MAELKKISCANCNKTILHANIQVGTISRDCPKCGQRNIVTGNGDQGMKVEIEVQKKKVSQVY